MARVIIRGSSELDSNSSACAVLRFDAKLVCVQCNSDRGTVGWSLPETLKELGMSKPLCSGKWPLLRRGMTGNSGNEIYI